MSRLRLRAVVLAAGRGERLRPLTAEEPKPLLPVLGEPVASRTLQSLKAAGCEAAAFNLHHLGERIRERLGSSFRGMPLTYSVEEEILGTLGALGPLREFLAPADLVLVVNGDSLCSWPLKRMIRRHLGSRPAATLLLARRASPRRFGGGVAVEEGRRIVSFSPGRGEQGRRRVFAGAHVFSPELLRRLPSGPADFIDHLYQPLLEEGGRIEGMETSRLWFDLGTPRRYLEGVISWSRRRPLGAVLRRGWRAPEARVEAEGRVRESVLEGGSGVGRGAEVVGSLLLAGSRVPAGGRIEESILGFGVELPAGATVRGRMVTRVRRGEAPRRQDSVLGELVYSPLDRPAAEESAEETG